MSAPMSAASHARLKFLTTTGCCAGGSSMPPRARAARVRRRAEQIEADAAGDSGQPGARRCDGVLLLGGHGVPTGVGLLHRVLRVGHRAQQPVGEIDQPGALARDRAQARTRLAAPSAHHHLAVAFSPPAQPRRSRPCVRDTPRGVLRCDDDADTRWPEVLLDDRRSRRWPIGVAQDPHPVPPGRHLHPCRHGARSRRQPLVRAAPCRRRGQPAALRRDRLVPGVGAPGPAAAGRHQPSARRGLRRPKGRRRPMRPVGPGLPGRRGGGPVTHRAGRPDDTASGR